MHFCVVWSNINLPYILRLFSLESCRLFVFSPWPLTEYSTAAGRQYIVPRMFEVRCINMLIYFSDYHASEWFTCALIGYSDSGKYLLFTPNKTKWLPSFPRKNIAHLQKMKGLFGTGYSCVGSIRVLKQLFPSVKVNKVKISTSQSPPLQCITNVKYELIVFRPRMRKSVLTGSLSVSSITIDGLLFA